MGTTLLAARILGVVYLAAGIAALRGKIVFSELVSEFEKSPALTFVTGFMTVTLGMILVTYHNTWSADWTVLITLAGWAALIKGILLIAFPGFIGLFKGWYKNTRPWGILLIALGLVFAYFGFLA